ncbi:hypothetical protein [Paeniglutamicibacter terrestris]|uniref:Uncharacterized protein n=1 Tax=Paeniglutamicibacter terrestris TaxID=2723403 RepID=A0ABX1G9M0_9MICC|nr:hypothetical protein [Paeniglutamicibacter terrestris]NKG22235.1 hypothetical protein [Paeniglutamicibacter terrestris]
MTRDEARTYTRAAVETYYKHFGQYVETPGQETIVLDLGARIGHRVAEATFEEALAIHERIDQLNDNTQTLAHGGLDVTPHDHDYPQAKAAHIESTQQELTAAIDRIVGNGPKGER